MISERDMEAAADWVAEVDGERCEERLDRLRTTLIDYEDVDEREADAIVEAVRARALGTRASASIRSALDVPPKTEQTVAPTPKAPARRRVQIYSPERRGFARAAREEAPGRQVREYAEQASGTPFFGREPPRPARPRTMTAELAERLGIAPIRKARR